MKDVKDNNPGYRRDHALIFDSLKEDMRRCKSVIDDCKKLQYIHDYCSNWKENNQDKN